MPLRDSRMEPNVEGKMARGSLLTGGGTSRLLHSNSGIVRGGVHAVRGRASGFVSGIMPRLSQLSGCCRLYYSLLRVRSRQYHSHHGSSESGRQRRDPCGVTKSGKGLNIVRETKKDLLWIGQRDRGT